MNDFMFFNELSLPLPDHNWEPIVKEYAEVIKQLQKKGFLNVRIEKPFKDLVFFTKTRNLKALINGLPRDKQSRIKSLFFNSATLFCESISAKK